MKTAIYFSENNLQLVLTPESEFEKQLLKQIQAYCPDHAYSGGFYLNQAGYIRMSGSTSYGADDSTMLRFPKPDPLPD